MRRAHRPVVALVTGADWPDLAPDDQFIAPALARHGFATEVVTWTDDRVQWDRFALVVVRSCWDYHHDIARWVAWVARVERAAFAKLHNVPAMLRWNARKTYLRDLAARGVPQVPTRWLEDADLSSAEALASVLDGTTWKEVVVKPAVSAGAWATHRLTRGAAMWTAADGRMLSGVALSELKSRGPVLVQPYLAEIADEGEWSLIFFDARFSHAVRKRPAPGDFRVQEKHGGTAARQTPGARLLAAAHQTLAAATDAVASPGGTAPLYARIDLLVCAGKPLLMELEVTEPALFLGNAPADASPNPSDNFARAIARRILPNPRLIG